MTTMVELLIDLGGNTTKLERLKNDPESVLGEYQLDKGMAAAVKKALDSGDPEPLFEHLSDEDRQRHGNVQVNIFF